jgi:PAS domain S-box-containing protein
MSSALPSAIQIHVLLIADKAADAELVQAALGSSDDQLFALEWCANLDQAVARLEDAQLVPVEIILLDLTLADEAGRNRGLSALELLIKAAPQALILVMGDERDDGAQQLKTRELRKRGAHDYFCKNHVDGYWLPRILRYATERKMTEQVMQAAEDALFETRERAETTLNSIGDAVLTIDLQGNLSYMNITAERMTGWPSGEALGLPLAQVFNLAEEAGGLSNLGARILAQSSASDSDPAVGDELKGNGLLRRRNGSDCNVEFSARSIRDREGKVSGAVLVFSDLSESRGLARRMTHLAQHDFLTGLPNRMLLTERLSQAIGRAHRRKGQVAMSCLNPLPSDW